MTKKKHIQRLPAPPAPRVETGAVQFGDDWPGLFLRGDQCITLVGSIRQLCENIGEEGLAIFPVGSLGRLAELLAMIERDVIVSRR